MLKPSSFILIILLFLGCSTSHKQKEIRLFAAASLSNVAQEIAKGFEHESGIKVKLNIASSGILARQIAKGASFDYYMSANRDWMNYLKELAAVDTSSIHVLAGNSLVAIVPNDLDYKIEKNDFVNHFPNSFQGRLSIGDPQHVPVGKYAMEVIRFYQWEKDLENRYLPAKNARDALLMVEMGEAKMGLVYATDALKSTKVRIVYRFVDRASDKIEYVGAAKKEKDEKLSSFIAYLKGKQVKKIWKDNGFKGKANE